MYIISHYYTSTQNTCTRLVQIAPCDANKHTIVTSSATTQCPPLRYYWQFWLASSSRRRRSRLINVRYVYNHANAESMSVA